MSKREKLVGVGLGAGLMGAVLLALKYAIRRPTKAPVPDTISPAIFKTNAQPTSLGEMVYHHCGHGQPLIFVHGVYVGASSYEWSKVYQEFAAGYQVLAPDLIGFGESARPDRNTTAADQTKALAEFIHATCAQPPILVGSGLGAGFCVYLASQHPELVSRLMLLMPTGLTEFGGRHLSAGTRLAGAIPLLNRFIYRNYQATKAAIRSWMTGFGFADASRVTDEAVEVLTTCAQQYGAEHAIHNLQSGRFSFDLENRMAMLTQPVTLMWSESAVFPPFDWAKRFQSMVKNCNVIALPKVGALAALEAPEEVASMLREQLQQELRVVDAGA